jgi:hypothetical protein
MPVFSKMMSSYPMGLIRGLGPGIAAGGLFGGGVGAVGSNRRGPRSIATGALKGAALGGAAYAGYKGYQAMGGREGIGLLGNILTRPGMSMANKANTGFRAAGTIIDNIKGLGFKGLKSMFMK